MKQTVARSPRPTFPESELPRSARPHLVSQEWHPPVFPEPGCLLHLPPTHIVAEAEPQGLSQLDLEQFATFLARKFHFDSTQAHWHPAGYYRELVGEAECSIEQAGMLRQMTADRCRVGERRHQLSAQRLRALWRRHGDLLDFFGLLTILLLLVLGASLWSHRHPEVEQPEPELHDVQPGMPATAMPRPAVRW